MNSIETKAVHFDLPFRGERSYLHSTSIFPAFVKYFLPKSGVKLEFRQLLNRPMYFTEKKLEGAEPAGSFSFDGLEGLRRFYIYPDLGREVTERVACIEKDVVAAGRREGLVFSGEIGMPGNFIETAVSLNKALVAGLAEPGKKIVFSAIDLVKIPSAGTVGVEVKKQLGTKLFVSDVLADGEKIGTLTFMAV